MSIGAAGIAGIAFTSGLASSMLTSAITGNCFSLGPLSIGNCGTESKINLKTEVITENVFKSMQETYTKNETEVYSYSDQNVVISGLNPAVCGGSIRVSQNAKIFVFQSEDINTKMVTDMMTSFSTEVERFLTQSQDQIKGALSDSSDMSLIMEASTLIKETTKKETVKIQITENLKNIINVTKQNVVLNFAALPTEVLKAAVTNPQGAQVCEVDQNIVFSITLETVVNTILEELNKDERLTKIREELDQKQKTENKGIVDVIADLLKSAIFGWVMVVIAVIIGLVLVWYFLLKNPEGVKALGSTAQGVMSSSKDLKTKSSQMELIEKK